MSRFDELHTPNKALQATGAARSDLDGEEDSLRLGFVVASFPAPVPELGRQADLSSYEKDL